MTAFQIPDMTAFQFYVLFGAPLLMLIFGLGVVLMNVILDSHHPPKSSNSARDHGTAGPSGSE
jgi:hypothetical protein